MTHTATPASTSAATPATASRTRAIALWALSLAWADVIFWWSSRPGSQIPGRFSEIGHLGEYCIFGALLYGALRSSGYRQAAAAAALVIASLYGVSDEFHQHFTPMRTPDVVDWGTDTLGAALGILAAITFARVLPRLRARTPAEKPSA